jgi:hypothetical protein
MTRTVDTSFTQFDNNLNLDPIVRHQAQRIHNEIRDELTRAGLIAGSFLQGSFARKTMLKPLKDVDIVCLLPTSMWEVLRGPGGPGAAMESFKTPIRAKWPDVRFDVCDHPGDKPAGKALKVTLPGLDFTIDLVPAFDQDGAYVLIGDRHEGTWTPSNTRIQLKNVSERNQDTGGRFVHQVREAKELTKHHDQLDFITGIVVESLLYNCLATQMTDKQAIARFLAHAKNAVRGQVLEPAGEDDVTAKWTDDQRDVAARTYAEASAKANEALRLEEAGDVDTALRVWHDLFGDAFPAPPGRSAHGILTAAAAGSLSIAGYPTSTQAASQKAAPARAWAPRPNAATTDSTVPSVFRRSDA